MKGHRLKGENTLWLTLQNQLIANVLRTDYNFIVRGLLLPYRNSLLSGAQFVATDARRFVRVIWVGFPLFLLFLSGTIDDWQVGGSRFIVSLLFTAFWIFLITNGLAALLGFKRKSLVDSLVPDPHFKYNSNAAQSAGLWAGLGVAIYGIYKAFFLF